MRVARRLQKGRRSAMSTLNSFLQTITAPTACVGELKALAHLTIANCDLARAKAYSRRDVTPPTEDDWQKAVAYARKNGLTVTEEADG